MNRRDVLKFCSAAVAVAVLPCAQAEAPTLMPMAMPKADPYQEFMRGMLAEIAAATCLTYAQLTKQYDGIAYGRCVRPRIGSDRFELVKDGVRAVRRLNRLKFDV